jgi:hypothetical protein
MTKAREPPLQWIEDEGHLFLHACTRMILGLALALAGMVILVSQGIAQVLLLGLASPGRGATFLPQKRSRSLPALTGRRRESRAVVMHQACCCYRSRCGC